MSVAYFKSLRDKGQRTGRNSCPLLLYSLSYCKSTPKISSTWSKKGGPHNEHLELVITLSDLVAFGIYFGGDILFTAISKVQKKSKKDDDLDLYDFEIETAPQKRSLCVDSIRMLYSGEIDEFVEKELLLDAAETMNALSEAEKTAVSLLLKAYIGFLSEEATVDEQSFPMVKELLSYTQGSKEDGEKDAIDCLMEDTVSRTHRHREYYNNYQRYQLMQVDKERVIMACNIIINDLIGRLYRYDYRFGYDITLASEHSIAKKLSDNWQNEWEVEDYEAGDC